MFSVLISGKLTKEPKPGTGKGGSPYCTALVRVPVQSQREDEPDCVFASVIAFGADAEKLGLLGAGDAVSLAGTARLSTWERDGKSGVSLNVTVTGILSAYQLRQKRGEPDRASRETSAPNAPWEVYGPATSAGAAFDDPIGF